MASWFFQVCFQLTWLQKSHFCMAVKLVSRSMGVGIGSYSIFTAEMEPWFVTIIFSFHCHLIIKSVNRKKMGNKHHFRSSSLALVSLQTSLFSFLLWATCVIFAGKLKLDYISDVKVPSHRLDCLFSWEELNILIYFFILKGKKFYSHELYVYLQTQFI